MFIIIRDNKKVDSINAADKKQSNKLKQIMMQYGIQVSQVHNNYVQLWIKTFQNVKNYVPTRNKHACRVTKSRAVVPQKLMLYFHDIHA